MAKVRIPLPWRRLTNGQALVEAQGKTLQEVFASLEGQFPGFGERLFEDNGEIKRFVNVFVNGDDIRVLDGASTETSDDDEVLIIPAVAGGLRELLTRLPEKGKITPRNK